VRDRVTGDRAYNYADVVGSTAVDYAVRYMNRSKRQTSHALQTADIEGAQPRRRSPSPSAGQEARDPQSPRYWYDTSSLVATVVRDANRAQPSAYGAFEKRGAAKRQAAAAAARNTERVPSSLCTAVEEPPEHPKSLRYARHRFVKEGIDRRRDPYLSLDEADNQAAREKAEVAASVGPSRPASAGPGVSRQTFTTFAREASGGRRTNPADPVYSYDTRAKPVPPPGRPMSAATARPPSGMAAMGSSTRVAPGASRAVHAARAAQRQADIDMVRSLPL
jgi:hypothetical protein